MQISSLKIENMENDIQQLQADFQNLFLKFYPVGSIYISTTNVNPQTVFGGEWERWGNGKTIIGVDEDDSTFSSVEVSGGEKVHTLSVSELPGHSHIFSGTAHSHTVGNHTHTVPAHAHSLNSHTHGFSDTSSSAGGHTHSISLTTGSDSHTHNIGMDFDGGSGSSRWTVHQNGTSGAGDTTKTSSDSHTHKVSGNTGSSGSHTHTVSGTTGKASGNTGNSAVLTTSGADIGTDSTVAEGTISETGDGASHNNLPPYITCYMWKRVA